MSLPLVYTSEVKEALEKGQPVVALESTIISHGMPYPDNVTMAKQVEQIVRENGATPATIALIDGEIKIGCSEVDIQMLASTADVMKVSRRDFPFAIANKKVGATTVAATMIAAEMAGIRVFATGGIGGVHRGWESSLDISADLYELQKTSVAVVSAGAKAILDIPATLEVLESFGVPVLGFKSHDFGAFYSRSSGIPLEMSMETPDAIANFMHVKWGLGLNGGVLISNPIPEQYEVPASFIEPVISNAVEEAKKLGINGKRLTPFLLGKIKEVTKGKSLEANLQLVYSNAALAGQIAKAYALKST